MPTTAVTARHPLTVLALFTAFTAATATAKETPPEFTVPIKADLPAPFATPSVNNTSQIVGWPIGKMPTAPSGFEVTAFGRLETPRWLHVLPDGGVLVAQSYTQLDKSPNKITLLRDADGDGVAELEKTLLDGLNQPLGMAVAGGTFFVANTDGVLSMPLAELLSATAKPKKIADLPAGGYNNHWTRNLLVSRDGKQLYITVGSASNNGEFGMDKEQNRACVLVMNLDGSDLRVFASGLRNPTGLAWEPKTGELWTAVNERDDLGDELVPDYLTHVQRDGFYGWPYAYFGPNEDPRMTGQRPDLVAKTIVPDVPMGSHTASLGLAFYESDAFPEKYRGGAFVGQRGSWNRSNFVGYRVMFVPFENGKPAGLPEEFLGGFIAREPQVYGRPVGVAVAKDGSLLVADEGGGIVWRVAVASNDSNSQEKQ
jgi:glucose/arabinose dehydrogenase